MAQQDGYTRYTIRIPTPLYERVKTAAGDASVNAKIIQLLEEACPISEAEELHALLQGTLESMEELSRGARNTRLRALRDALKSADP